MKKRVFKNFNEEGFKDEVKKINWWNIYRSEDPDYAAEQFSFLLCKALDKFAPVRKIQVRTKYRSWISTETKEMMNHRDKAQDLARYTDRPEHWTAFKVIRNKVVTRVRREKKSWEEKQLDHLTSNPSTLWRNVKSWMG